MADIEYEGLQPEVFSNELTWLEFFEALSEMIEEQVRSPIKELETIREIIETTDPVIVANSIKQMGFDIPLDLIAHNVDRLARAIYMLPLFHETSGTTQFTKAISFVLGRETVVHDLYTKDYVNFYRQPYGPMNVDGGDWYKTTHIGLAMEMVSTDRNLIVAEGQTIRDRLIDAFYEFAPVNLVIENFRYLIRMWGTLHVTGKVEIMPWLKLRIGNGNCVRRLVIEAPERVREATSQMVRVGLSVCDYAIPTEGLPMVFSGSIGIDTDNAITQQSLTYFPDDSSPQQFTVDVEVGEYGYFVYPSSLGLATFTGASGNYENVEGGWDGAKWPNDGSVGTETGPLLITRDIEGQTSTWYLYRTDFPSLDRITFNVEFENPGAATSGEIAEHHYIPVYSVDWTTNKTSLVGFNSNGQLDFGLVSRDTTVTVTARHKGLIAKADIVIEAFNDDIVSIDIVGPDEVMRGDTVQYTPVGVFKDGQRGQIDATITLVSPYASINNNNLTVFDVKEDITVFLMSEYTARSGAHVIGSKKVVLKYIDPNVYLVSLETTISQPTPSSVGAQAANSAFHPDDELYEGDERKITAIATFSDNSTQEVQPYFKSSSPSLYVAPDGTATAGITDGPVHVSVDATYQFRGMKAVSKNVLKIIKEDIFIESLRILGSTTVVELSRSQYSAIATWSDGTTTPVNVEWSTDKFSITESGVFIAGSTDSPKNVRITAKVDDREASFNVVVIDTPIVLQNINIVGPNNVKAEVNAQYSAFAHYSNNTEVEITPTWSVYEPVYHDILDDQNNVIGRRLEEVPISGATIDTNGVFVFTGIPETTLAEIKAVYNIGVERFVQTLAVVLVPKTSIITSLLISGPDEVDELDRIILRATATYEDGSAELVHPLWSAMPLDPVNETEIMADVVSPGVVQGRTVNTDTKVVIVARYFKEVAEHIVTVRNRIFHNADVPYSSRIVGPATVNVNDVGSYAQLIEFENGCGEVMVSSDWALDVDPAVALIDDDGYIHSVSGAPVPVTIYATYSCGNHLVTDTFVMNFISNDASLDSLLITGPANVLANSEQSYFAELFRNGETQTPGEGTPIAASEIEWRIVPNIVFSGGVPLTDVTIDESGRLYVGPNAPDDAQFDIIGTYTEGFESIDGQITVTISRLFPIYGVGPIGVNTDSEIVSFLTQELPDNSNGQVINLTLNAGEYGYFAHPASLGTASFLDNASSFEGGWDGASWPNNGTIGAGRGPLSIVRNINGNDVIWYLYRTDFAALGSMSYTVTFS